MVNHSGLRQRHCYRKKPWLRKETLCAIPKYPQTTWQLIPNKETMVFHNKVSFEENEKTSKRIQCPICSMDWIACTTFCVLCLWCRANNLDRGTRGASSTFAPKRLCLHPNSYEVRLTTSKPERQHLRAEHCSSTAKPRTITQRPLQKVSTWETPKKQRSVPTHKGRTRSSLWWLEDRNRLQFGRTRRCQTEPRILFSLSADKGILSRWREPHAKFETTDREIGRQRRRKANILRRGLAEMACSISWSWSDWR